MLANSEPEYVFAQLQSVRYPKVVDVIEGKATPIVTHAEIRRSMKVMMAAFESAKK